MRRGKPKRQGRKVAYVPSVFLIPQSYSGSGNFYTENRQNVGNLSTLTLWLQAQENVIEVEDVTGDYDNVYAALQVTGSGLVPTSFYYDHISPRTRVFATNNPVSPVIACAMPVIGDIDAFEQVCATPDMGDAIIQDVPLTELSFIPFGVWDLDGGESEGYFGDGYGRFDLTMTSAAFSVGVYLTNEMIATLTPAAIPSNPQLITIDSDTFLTIDNYGRIYYTGYPTGDDDTVVIELLNIYYVL